MLLGRKDSQQKYYSSGYDFCRVCEFACFIASGNIGWSCTSVSSAVMLGMEECGDIGRRRTGTEGRRGLLVGDWGMEGNGSRELCLLGKRFQ